MIRGAAEVLADDAGLSAAQRERVARIERATDEMGELIAALLLLAREQVTQQEETCDARLVALNCIERYRPLADSRSTTLGFEAPAVVEILVPSALFAIVLANLVHNAVAHTQGGDIAVELGTAALMVRDTGSGIHDEALDRVFERYYRGPESTGAGIGLSLVKRICDRLGWRIELESDHVSGTAVTLRF